MLVQQQREQRGLHRERPQLDDLPDSRDGPRYSGYVHLRRQSRTRCVRKGRPANGRPSVRPGTRPRAPDGAGLHLRPVHWNGERSGAAGSVREDDADEPAALARQRKLQQDHALTHADLQGLRGDGATSARGSQALPADGRRSLLRQRVGESQEDLHGRAERVQRQKGAETRPPSPHKDGADHVGERDTQGALRRVHSDRQEEQE